MDPLNIIVAVTGASGSVYAGLLLEELRRFRSAGQIGQAGIVFSEKAKEVWAHEIGPFQNRFPFTVYNNSDFNAPFASGSSLYDVMIVCPCSMGTMGRIANGLSDTLITRAADVMLKERRRLILAVRETPVHLIHINNMQILAQAGAIIAPASPSFYSHPQSVEELAMTVVGRLLQLTGLRKETYRWGEQ
ncbi:MAG: UbiX family flavin prenyltransferase [Bacteroidales bacterium]|jgi:4-hydroxy-3-polyprenylbenzoate decarboxylase|nr:UbiX family flavin prenyltransferase [Bacteroidales bacterium]